MPAFHDQESGQTFFLLRIMAITMKDEYRNEILRAFLKISKKRALQV